MTKSRDSCYKSAVPIRVFIFEDHWMCREALIAVLSKSAGIELCGASDQVEDGLKECKTLKPHVVIMGVQFRGEKLGIEATAALRKTLPDAKVVIFTEFPDEEILRSAVQAGASGFLMKKEVEDPDVITSAIQAVHRGEAYLTPSMTAKILNVVRHLSDNDKYGLTKREIEVLNLIAEGSDNRGIAKGLSIDERTVANHVSNLLFKMSAKNRTEAAAIARRSGIIS